MPQALVWAWKTRAPPPAGGFFSGDLWPIFAPDGWCSRHGLVGVWWVMGEIPKIWWDWNDVEDYENIKNYGLTYQSCEKQSFYGLIYQSSCEKNNPEIRTCWLTEYPWFLGTPVSQIWGNCSKGIFVAQRCSVFFLKPVEWTQVIYMYIYIYIIHIYIIYRYVYMYICVYIHMWNDLKSCDIPTFEDEPHMNFSKSELARTCPDVSSRCFATSNARWCWWWCWPRYCWSTQPWGAPGNGGLHEKMVMEIHDGHPRKWWESSGISKNMLRVSAWESWIWMISRDFWHDLSPKS